jgi:uncharacterized membrane protein YdjX (TVP38/TMEM64 family)
MRIYIGCLIALGAMWFYVLSNAPPPPAIEECDNFGFYAVITVGKDPTALTRMIKCAQAYQKFNWWFVVCTFFLTYIGIKMFAIPAVFPLGILGGAIFPFWLSLGLTGSGEALGNSLCYLMSASIAQPVLERLFPQKLAKVAQKAEEEKVSGRRHRHLHRHRHHLHRHHLHHQENWLLFNFFLRLTPFVPNWFVNLSSPIVGNPIKPFIIGSFFGTQARRHPATPTCARPEPARPERHAPCAKCRVSRRLFSSRSSSSLCAVTLSRRSARRHTPTSAHRSRCWLTRGSTHTSSSSAQSASPHRRCPCTSSASESKQKPRPPASAASRSKPSPLFFFLVRM